MLERIDVVCTGGLYDDPETGLAPRHAVQKLGRLWVRQRMGTIGGLFQREPPKRCPACGRTVPVAGREPAWETPGEPTPEERRLYPSGYTGGVWQRIVDQGNRESPDRRVLRVDISDPRYPW